MAVTRVNTALVCEMPIDWRCDVGKYPTGYRVGHFGVLPVE